MNPASGDRAFLIQSQVQHSPKPPREWRLRCQGLLSPLCTMQRRAPALERPYREASASAPSSHLHRGPLPGKGAALPLSPSLAHLGSFSACVTLWPGSDPLRRTGGKDEAWKDEAPTREGSPQALPPHCPPRSWDWWGRGGRREGRRRRSSPCIPPRFTVGAGRENRAGRLQAPRVFRLERAEWE